MSYTHPKQAATVTVAAPDSLHPERADYPCDGTNDVAQMQAAIDAIPASGGRIVASEGTFTWGSEPVWKSNITFQGQGKGTKIILTANISPFLLEDMDDTTFQNFYVWFDGTAYTQTAPIICLKGVTGGMGQNHFDNIWIRQSRDTGHFSAILLEATGASGIYSNTFTRIYSYNPSIGVEFKTSGTGWVNVNEFAYCTFWLPHEYGIKFSAGAGSSGSNSNKFWSWLIQSQITTTVGILMDANSSGNNEFYGIDIIDLPSASKYININTGNSENLFFGGTVSYGNHYTDNGTKTIIIDRTQGIRAFKATLYDAEINLNQNTVNEVLYLHAKGDDSFIGIKGGETCGAEIHCFGKSYTAEAGKIWFDVVNAGGSGMVRAMDIEGMTDTPAVEVLHTLKTDTITERSIGAGITYDAEINLNQNTVNEVLYLHAKGDDSFIGIKGGETCGAEIHCFGKSYTAEAGKIWFDVVNAGGSGMVRAMDIEGMTDTPAVDIKHKFRVSTPKTPASASASGTTGDICWDSSYVYICTATNTWRRIAHATW